MLENLKAVVCEANKSLPRLELVRLTWGNVSAVDRSSGLFVIKPSGVDYAKMTPEHMVVLDMDGKVVEGDLRPSSDAATHLEIYLAFPAAGAVVHVHSTYATSWAQAGRAIPCYGTTHADYFYGEIPCLRCLNAEEIELNYEENTGRMLVNEFIRMGKDPRVVPAVICQNHGLFTWGKDAFTAVQHAIVVEEVAKMAYLSEQLNPAIEPAPRHLQAKHYNRKHGADAYYGQIKI